MTVARVDGRARLTNGFFFIEGLRHVFGSVEWVSGGLPGVPEAEHFRRFVVCESADPALRMVFDYGDSADLDEKLMAWAQGIVTAQPSAAAYLADVHWIFKTHILLGLTIFLVFPFTRLVHVWSAPIWYLGRTGYQVVRTRRNLRAGVAKSSVPRSAGE